MTLPAELVQPPRIATWLVGLFISAGEDESVLGDLLEEFSQLASKSGVACARRWYWRQSLKTVAHLMIAGFRRAPWSTTAAVVGGFLLHGWLQRLPGAVLSKVTDRYLMFWSSHFQAYLWVLDGMAIAHLLASLAVGCAVALAAKGRELFATITLALVLCGMIGAAWIWIAMHGRMDVGWIVWSCADSMVIVVGGVMVRMRRSHNVNSQEHNSQEHNSQEQDSSPKRLGVTGD